ncbi:MAG: long-chain fatty acid--CoA ligase, partial [Candidatus Hydrogenedentota bacterium]
MIQAKHLPELAEKALQVQGERRTFWMMGEFVTNVQIADRARRFKRALEEHGIGKGDVACMCIVNNPYVYSIFGGIFRTGATAAPVMFQLSAKELNYIFGHTEAKCIITDSLLIDKVREAVKDLPHVEWIGVLGGQDNETATPREYRLDSFFERDPDPAIPAIESDDVAIMLYTSGTTGRPKGVMLSHANLLASAKAGYLASEFHAREHPIVSINALPMAHIFGVGVMNSGYLANPEFTPGYAVQEIWFDPDRFMKLIDEHKVTDVAGVPTMLAMLLNHPTCEQYDLRSLKVASIGAAPLSVDLARQFSERTGCRIRQIYGMTENTGIGAGDRISRPYRPGSTGPAYDDMQLRVVDDNGNDMPPGQSGEIVTRGPSTMKGYFGLPEAPAETMR